MGGVSALFGGGDDDMPEPVQAENVKRTAPPVEQISEQDARNRRLRASALTRGFSRPQLSQPGLLGV